MNLLSKKNKYNPYSPLLTNDGYLTETSSKLFENRFWY